MWTGKVTEDFLEEGALALSREHGRRGAGGYFRSLMRHRKVGEGAGNTLWSESGKP